MQRLSLNRNLVICSLVFLIVLHVSALAAGARAADSKALQIYFIDVEGGQSTLVVGPAGQSLLIDTGYAGFDGRDADRIVAAAKAAGVTQIDNLLITHYHADHSGGVAELASRIKVVTFLDHGPNTEDSGATRKAYADYVKTITHGKHGVLKPGDEIPVAGLKIEVLTAAGEERKSALAGAGQANPYCAQEPYAEPEPSENAQSVGILVTYGKFRFLDLADLSRKNELELMCPNNLIGTVDLILATHHAGDPSDPRAAVLALQPKVAVINAGAHKGGNPATLKLYKDSPSVQAIWQLHYVMDAGKDLNTAEGFIANLEEKCSGNYLKATALPNGTFTVTNSSNNHQETYPKQAVKASGQ